MRYYHVNDPACLPYKVELDGVIMTDVVEANSDEGWVKTVREVPIWGGKQTIRKTHYGRVHIVRYIDWDDEEETVPTPEEENPEPTYD